jgi:AcrR family transcriptional regulator
MRGISGEIAKILAVGGSSAQRLHPSTASLARRADIIAAAIRVIARDGIRGCTVTALERATGFARGHFSYHFKSKEEIIGLAFAAVGSDWATTQIRAAVGASARERLEGHVRAAAEWVQQRPDYFLCLMNFRVEMMRNPATFPPAAQIRRQMWAACADIIREGVTEGSFRPRADPLVEARTVFGTIDGLLMYSVMDSTFCAAAELSDLVWRIVADRLGV